MESPVHDVSESEVLKILDEEFQNYFLLALAYLRKIKSKINRKICKKYLDKCLSLNKPDKLVKTNRNLFLRTFLQIMAKTYEENKDWPDKNPVQLKSPEQFQQFSEDNRTFVALKEFSDTGVMIYMAKSNESEPKWGKFDLSTVNLNELDSKITFMN